MFQDVTLKNRMTLLTTGNNVQYKGDITRRVLRARLMPKDEFPSQRSGFKYSRLDQHVREHRVELYSACLVIVAAYIRAGRPKVALTSFGSFEAWNGTIRGALLWLGEADPLETQAALREESDPDREAGLQFLDALHTVFGEDTFTSNQVAKIVSAPALTGLEAATDLAQAFEALSPKKPSTRELAYWLSKFADRILMGKALRKNRRTKLDTIWHVEIITEDPS